ncbi:MAG TPA: ATP synthase F0 subunit A [Proteobacteria bacterium]|nr:ATP synthase F0 subunit A [Pseudomonadota bacterium]
MLKRTAAKAVLIAALFLTPATAFAFGHEVQLFHLIPGVNRLPMHVVLFFVVGILLLALAFAVRRQILPALEQGEEALAPPEKFGLRTVFEMATEMTMSLGDQTIDKGARPYASMLLGLTFVILFSNLIGLIPGFSPPTGNWSTTVALAIAAFVYYHICGFKEHGLSYLMQFLGPLEMKWYMRIVILPFTLIMLLIEVVGHLARILSLSVRLFANMFADHMVISVFASLVAVPLLFTVPFSALGLLVCLIQTLVFVFLTIVYIALAVSHEH